MDLKESLDSLYGIASDAAQAAARKTKQLAEIAKANLSIYAEEDKIKKAQVELGKLYYRDYVLGEEQDEAEYLPWCQKIDESKQTIADMRDYIDELKSGRVEITEDDVVVVAEEAPAEAAVPAEEAASAETAAPVEDAKPDAEEPEKPEETPEA